MLTSMQSTATDFESHDAFLCYAGEDQSAADRLLAALTSRRKTIWVADERIIPGSEWEPLIGDAGRFTESSQQILTRQPRTTR